MQKIEFRIKDQKKLSKAIIDELPFLSNFEIRKLLANKDVKVNNIRTNIDKTLNSDDQVVVYYQGRESKAWYTTVYEDHNILIVNKRAGIEIVSETDRDL